jgi:hypothetical protein
VLSTVVLCLSTLFIDIFLLTLLLFREAGNIPLSLKDGNLPTHLRRHVQVVGEEEVLFEQGLVQV